MKKKGCKENKTERWGSNICSGQKISWSGWVPFAIKLGSPILGPQPSTGPQPVWNWVAQMAGEPVHTAPFARAMGTLTYVWVFAVHTSTCTCCSHRTIISPSPLVCKARKGWGWGALPKKPFLEMHRIFRLLRGKKIWIPPSTLWTYEKFDRV